MSDSPHIAYADLVLEKDDNGSTVCRKAYCVYENTNQTCEKDIDELHTYQNQARSQTTDEPEYVVLISEDEAEEDDGDDEGDYELPEDDVEEDEKRLSSDSSDGHSYIDLDVEIMQETEKLRQLNYGGGSYSLVRMERTVKPKESVVKPPAHMMAAGMAALVDDRIVVVAQSGEIIVFDSTARFLFLREFHEKYEDMTTIDDNTIATTSGFSIRFYQIQGSNIVELGDRLIDFEYCGCDTVHGIHHFHGKLAVTCNIATVYATQKPFIKIIDLKGKLIRTIGKPDFHVPAKITCSWDGKMIFVCDHELKKVSCLTNNGTVQWEKTGDRVPKDIELVNDSELFVVFENSDFVEGLVAATGKIKSRARAEVPAEQTPSLLTFQRQRGRLVFSLEELVVGIPNFIIPLKVKKAKTKSFSFSKAYGKKALSQR